MELYTYSRFVLVLAFVVALIWLTGYLMKRFGLDKHLRGVTGQKGRLAVVDVLYLDPKRKLTLLRADDKEYLVLMNEGQALLMDRFEGKKHDHSA